MPVLQVPAREEGGPGGFSNLPKDEEQDEARTTIEEIIINLNVLGEERKRTVLARSRKRAEILYPLKRKSIVFVFVNLFASCFF